jgi:hypothetical protein
LHFWRFTGACFNAGAFLFARMHISHIFGDRIAIKKQKAIEKIEG